MKRRWLLLVCVFSSAGCIPSPHMADHLPPISGRVLQDGQGAPLPGRELRLSRTRPYGTCGDDFRTATTDEDGAFSFEGDRRFHLFRVIVPTHMPIGWTLCLDTPSGPVLVDAAFTLLGDALPPVRLVCSQEICMHNYWEPLWVEDRKKGLRRFDTRADK